MYHAHCTCYQKGENGRRKAHDFLRRWFLTPQQGISTNLRSKKAQESRDNEESKVIHESRITLAERRMARRAPKNAPSHTLLSPIRTQSCLVQTHGTRRRIRCGWPVVSQKVLLCTEQIYIQKALYTPIQAKRAAGKCTIPQQHGRR